MHIIHVNALFKIWPNELYLADEIAMHRADKLECAKMCSHAHNHHPMAILTPSIIVKGSTILVISLIISLSHPYQGLLSN